MIHVWSKSSAWKLLAAVDGGGKPLLIHPLNAFSSWTNSSEGLLTNLALEKSSEQKGLLVFGCARQKGGWSVFFSQHPLGLISPEPLVQFYGNGSVLHPATQTALCKNSLTLKKTKHKHALADITLSLCLECGHCCINLALMFYLAANVKIRIQIWFKKSGDDICGPYRPAGP